METVEIRRRLSDAMALRCMRAVELAEKTGISKASISQYLSGHVEPKSDRIYLMAQALHVNPVWLMGLDVQMETRTAPEGTDRVLRGITLSSGEPLFSSPKIQQLVEDFTKLNQSQQESVLALVHSMIPNTNQQ